MKTIINLLTFINNIFFIDKKKEYKEIYFNKTIYYKKEINNFSLDWVYISIEYNKNIQKDLKNFKYKYNISSVKLFNKYLENNFLKYLADINKENTIITGIPIFFINRIFKPYNHTYLLAKIFSKNNNINFYKLLIKTKYNKSQSKLNKKERYINIKNCFKINNKFINNIKWKNIIIIDDVVSSWNTLNEAWKILKKYWAKKVYWLILTTWK